MDHPDKRKELLEWLGLPENEQWLDKLARSAAKRLKRENLLEGILGEAPETYSFSGNKENSGSAFNKDTVDTVKNEMFLFLMNSTKSQEIFAAVYGASGGYFLKAFINHCRGRSRAIAVNPRKFFRRAALDIIRNADDLSSGSIGTGKKESFLDTYGRNPCNGVIDPLSDDEKRNIPFTIECQKVFSDARKDALINGKAMHHTLCFFLDQALALKKTPGMWARTDDFIDWFMHNRPRNLPIPTDMHDKACWQNDSGNFLDVDDMLPDSTKTSDAACYYDIERITSWAPMCAALLTGEEKELLFQKWVKGLNPRQIAETRDDVSRNTVENRTNRAIGKIQSFLVDKPWVSIDDLNEEAFAFFMERLHQELEKACLKP